MRTVFLGCVYACTLPGWGEGGGGGGSTCRPGLRLERMRGSTSAETFRLVGAHSRDASLAATPAPEEGRDEERMVAVHTSRQKASMTGPVPDMPSASDACLLPGLEAPGPSPTPTEINQPVSRRKQSRTNNFCYMSGSEIIWRPLRLRG